MQDVQEQLPDCLDSISFCDEIVVVDGGSRDATVQVALAAGATVVRHPWAGFAAQRNVAIAAATGDWILEVDADERVTPELRAAIEAFLAAPPDGVDIAALPCREVLVGRTLLASTKYPKYRHRLFRRGRYRHDETRTVHEGLVPAGPVAALEGDLVHLLADRWGEALADAWRYARLEAQQAAPAGSARAYAANILVRPLAKAGWRLAVDGGWRDGWGGVAKIALDCGSDAVVWARVLAGRGGGGARAAARDGHFGRVEARLGPVRIVGLAAGARAVAATARWLEDARGAGADVALVTDAPQAAPAGLRVRAVRRFTPLLVVRALDAERQLRDVDALAAGGRVAARAAALAPAALRGGAAALDCGREDGVAAVRRLHEATRC